MDDPLELPSTWFSSVLAAAAAAEAETGLDEGLFADETVVAVDDDDDDDVLLSTMLVSFSIRLVELVVVDDVVETWLSTILSFIIFFLLHKFSSLFLYCFVCVNE